jgi:hypothetical protein
MVVSTISLIGLLLLPPEAPEPPELEHPAASRAAAISAVIAAVLHRIVIYPLHFPLTAWLAPSQATLI